MSMLMQHFSMSAPIQVHRGVNVELSGDDIDEALKQGDEGLHRLLVQKVMRPGKSPFTLQDHPGEGMGTHWTRRQEVAENFSDPGARHAEPKRSHIDYHWWKIPVTLHGTVDPQHVEDDPEALDAGRIEGRTYIPSVYHDEQEVMLKPGAPVNITRIRARLPKGDLGEHYEEHAWNDSGSSAPHHWVDIHPGGIQAQAAEDYRGSHQAPGPEEPGLHEVPDDFLEHPEFFGQGRVAPVSRYHCGVEHEGAVDSWRGTQEGHAQAVAAKGNPEHPVTIYRSVPQHVQHIHSGDWVTLSGRYAQRHAESNLEPGAWKILKATVPAKHVNWDWGDAHEWGYNGPDVEHAEEHADRHTPLPYHDEDGGVIRPTANRVNLNDKGRPEMYHFTGHEPEEGQHAYFRGLYLGNEDPRREASVPIDPDEILDRIRATHERQKQRGMVAGPEHPSAIAFGHHWTTDPQTARDFSLDPTHGQFHPLRRDRQHAGLGAVIEVHSTEPPKKSWGDFAGREAEVDTPPRDSITKAWLHVHRYDPNLTQESRYSGEQIPVYGHHQNTLLHTSEIPLSFVKQAVQQRPDPDPVEYHHVPPPYWGDEDFSGGFHSIQARHDGRQVGYLHWWDPGEGPWKGIKNPAVEKVEVATAHRRRGLAAEMLRRAQEITPGIGPSDELTSDGHAWRDAVHPDSAGAPFRPARMLPRLGAQEDVDAIMDLLGPGVPKAKQPTKEEKAQADAEHSERVRKHQEWQATRKGYNPGDDTSDWEGYKNQVDWVPIGVAQHFREHTGDQHKGSEDTIAEIHQQLASGRGITDPLMLLHHNEENRASLGEGNHRLVAMERAGWTRVPMRVVRMYDSEAERGKGRSIPHAWRGTWQGRTPEVARPADVLSPGALGAVHRPRSIDSKDS